MAIQKARALETALERARARFASIREESKAITGRTVNSALTVGTAAGFAYLAKTKGEGAEKAVKVPGTDLDVDLLVGSLAAVAGVAGLADNYSDNAAAIGSGALAAFSVRKILLGS